MNKIDRPLLLKKSGVYSIKNIKNNNIYIGSSVDLYDRILHHKNCLKRRWHPNPNINYDLNNGFSAQDFEYGILEFCDKKNLIITEQIWIDKYENTGNSYNDIRSINRLITNKPSNKYTTKNYNNFQKTTAERRLKQAETMKMQIKSWGKEIREKAMAKQRIKCFIYSPDGDVYYVENVPEFAKKHNLNYSKLFATLGEFPVSKRVKANGEIQYFYLKGWKGWSMKRFDEALVTPQMKIAI